MKDARERADRARVFFALWPDDAVRATLAARALDARAESGGRAIVAANVHLTLFFVGSVERARLPSLERAASLPRADAFSLVLDEIGYWRHNRIVWAGSTQCPTPLSALVADLNKALAEEGIESEDRPYVPHVTLLRNAERKPRMRRMDPCVWDAREFVLVESVAVAGGVRYEPRASWPLGVP